MKLRHFYLTLCVLGFALPYSQFVPWGLKHGLNLALFFRELFANRVSAFFALDVIVSGIVLIVFVLVEGRRLGMRGVSVSIAGTLLVGVSLGLPLFLYLREVQLDRDRN
jgi:Terpene cyclase DEP1